VRPATAARGVTGSTHMRVPAILPTTQPAPQASTEPTRDAASADFRQALEQAQRVRPDATTVKPTRTPLTGTQAASALAQAWKQRHGRAADPGTITLLTAHWAHETDRGRAMLNFNFGGIKGKGPEGLQTSYVTHEGSGSSRARQVDTFRAYSSAESGARDYLELLGRRYPQALAAAEAGEPAAFVRALKAGGYFTADEQSYQRSIAALNAQARAGGLNEIGVAAPDAPDDLEGPPLQELTESAFLPFDGFLLNSFSPDVTAGERSSLLEPPTGAREGSGFSVFLDLLDVTLRRQDLVRTDPKRTGGT
jgi:flagellum-specific peptidoglycan hydrolase FlgJ